MIGTCGEKKRPQLRVTPTQTGLFLKREKAMMQKGERTKRGRGSPLLNRMRENETN